MIEISYYFLRNIFVLMRQSDIHITNILCDKPPVSRCCKFSRDTDSVSPLDSDISLLSLLLISIDRIMTQISENFLQLPLPIYNRKSVLPLRQHAHWLVDTQSNFLYLFKIYATSLPVPSKSLWKNCRIRLSAVIAHSSFCLSHCPYLNICPEF